MTAHRIINIAIAIAGGCLIAAVLSCADLLGPDDIDTARLQSQDLQAAKRAAHARARFEQAAQQACGDNAGYAELAVGVVQCFTHRGSKTHIAEVRQ